MSDDFIPLNQSTPVQERWQNQSLSQNQQDFLSNRFHNKQRRGYNRNRRGGNNSQRNSSYGSDSNSSFGPDKRIEQKQDKSIDAYLHPSMLQDPWAQLRMKND